ncbi:helix-turn-helix domain-containing protein [Arachidicoccus terrestris]|uniref:helix-turn-helix domain-containing protein n=1 Tax=Arachidicoccus terrestris TaxID=2875539 RepID=UPI001CC69F4E|nr:helix-turn-helix domain-containing protein [Arachidicoccus terrestris]UAY56661.1 helix-turn-helix domain-containing protein [Arachidicoccus terrestris]
MNNEQNPFTEINSRLEALSLEVQNLGLMKIERPEDENEVLDLSGASTLLKIPEASIRFHIKNNLLPCHKPGRRLLFLKNELLNWLVSFGNGEVEEQKAKLFKKKYNLK